MHVYCSHILTSLNNIRLNVMYIISLLWYFTVIFYILLIFLSIYLQHFTILILFWHCYCLIYIQTSSVIFFIKIRSCLSHQMTEKDTQNLVQCLSIDFALLTASNPALLTIGYNLKRLLVM